MLLPFSVFIDGRGTFKHTILKASHSFACEAENRVEAEKVSNITTLMSVRKRLHNLRQDEGYTFWWIGFYEALFLSEVPMSTICWN